MDAAAASAASTSVVGVRRERVGAVGDASASAAAAVRGHSVESTAAASVMSAGIKMGGGRGLNGKARAVSKPEALGKGVPITGNRWLVRGAE